MQQKSRSLIFLMCIQDFPCWRKDWRLFFLKFDRFLSVHSVACVVVVVSRCSNNYATTVDHSQSVNALIVVDWFANAHRRRRLPCTRLFPFSFVPVTHWDCLTICLLLLMIISGLCHSKQQQRCISTDCRHDLHELLTGVVRTSSTALHRVIVICWIEILFVVWALIIQWCTTVTTLKYGVHWRTSGQWLWR